MTNIREFRGVFYIVKFGKATGVTRDFSFENREQLENFIEEHRHSYKLKEAYSISKNYEMNKVL